MQKYLTLVLILTLFGCVNNRDDNNQMKLPNRFNQHDFDKMQPKAKELFINNLNTTSRMILIKILIANRGLGSEWGLIKFYNDGEFIYDYYQDEGGMTGGNWGDDKFNYLLGKWEADENKIILIKNKKDEIADLILDKEIWIDYSAYAYPDGELYLRFKRDAPGKSGDYDTSFKYETAVESPAIDSYTEKKMIKK